MGVAPGRCSAVFRDLEYPECDQAANQVFQRRYSLMSHIDDLLYAPFGDQNQAGEAVIGVEAELPCHTPSVSVLDPGHRHTFAEALDRACASPGEWVRLPPDAEFPDGGAMRVNRAYG